MVFLVAQRLDRRRVERLHIALLSQIYGEIRHHGFPGAGRCRHKHIGAGLKSLVGILLKGIQLEWHTVREPCRYRLHALPRLLEGPVPFGRAEFTLVC